MTTDEAAARLGLSVHTVKYHCQRGHIQATKHPDTPRGIYWITEQALQDFIDTRQVGPGNKTGQPRRATTPTGDRAAGPERGHAEGDTG